MSSPIPLALLDTDILSAVMRQKPAVMPRARAYLAANGQLTFSIITRYEVLRGLYARGATTQLAAFNRLCRANVVLPLTDAIVVRAAGIYADLHRRGMLIGDADILIAATALEQNRTVVTNNESHFVLISGLSVENWLR
jgi:tRNA(fMet)-specific endonuclease VapC